jgi:anion-transporting  ArsA/GET3 family ATPase
VSGITGVVDRASVVVCCGSGGVGKTTTAAAIGLHAAEGGRRVVVVTIDPARRLADALGLPEGLTGEPQRVPVDAGSGELWAMMLDAEAMFERVVRANATDTEQADRIVANRFYRNMASALSGTQEYMASEALHELHADDRFDLVVVDTPPTRTGLRVFNAATQPMLRLIGRVVGSDVLTDAVAFFQAFAGMEAGFRQRADAVAQLLRADGTEFVLVTSPQRDALVEAAWFVDQLDERGYGVAATVVNRIHPAFGSATSDSAAKKARKAIKAGDHDAAALWTNLAQLCEVAENERAEVDAHLTRRTGDGTGPVVEVPLLPSDVHDIDSLDHLGTHLFA